MNPIAAGRPGRLVPSKATRFAGLAALILLLAVLASLGSILGSAAGRAAVALKGRLEGAVTVVVRGSGLESPEAAAARAVEILDARATATQASAMEPADADALVGWGVGGRAFKTPAVRLIRVSLAGGDPRSARDLVGGLARQGIAAAADDHRGRGGPLERSALALAAGAAGLALLVLGSVAGVGFAASGRVVRRLEGRFDLMRRLGATRRGLARLASGPVATMVVSAAALGAGLAVAIGAFLAVRDGARPGIDLGGAGFAPRLDRVDLAAALAWPIVFGLAGWAGAAAGGRAALRRLEGG